MLPSLIDWDLTVQSSTIKIYKNASIDRAIGRIRPYNPSDRSVRTLPIPKPDPAFSKAPDPPSQPLGDGDYTRSSKRRRIGDEVMDRLMAGDGVSSFEMQGLFERCDRCHLHFLSTALRLHILSCRAEN